MSACPERTKPISQEFQNVPFSALGALCATTGTPQKASCAPLRSRGWVYSPRNYRTPPLVTPRNLSADEALRHCRCLQRPPQRPVPSEAAPSVLTPLVRVDFQTSDFLKTRIDTTALSRLTNHDEF